MKHAHRLAMDGHGELAQFLRDAMTDAQRYAWLRGNAVREKNVEWILEDGHMNQEHLARLRAAWEGV